MLAQATVRVRADDPGGGGRPCREDLERAAELLRACGFEVLRVGRFGVTVQAEPDLFTRELGIVLRAGEPLVGTPAPRNRDLAPLIDLVEVTGPPRPAAGP